MIDRHLLGDIGLAILLAMPTLALARPQATLPDTNAHTAPLVQQAAIAERTTPERRSSLPS